MTCARILVVQRPALMTLDLRMPRVDGWCVLERLAGMPWRPPVVVISAHGEGDRVRALGRSDVLYLDKPFGIDELLGLCRALLLPASGGRDLPTAPADRP